MMIREPIPYSESKYGYYPYSPSKLNAIQTPDLRWSRAIAVSQTCMAAVFVNQEQQGMGVFVKNNELLIPRHLLNKGSYSPICHQHLTNLMNSIQIVYHDYQYCYQEQVVSILEDGKEKDYCLLKIANQIPCIIPTFSTATDHQECLFAKIVDGQVIASLASSCQGNPGALCGTIFNQSESGSSGGVYIDNNGHVIGIHLGQSNGRCNSEIGDEKKILFMHEFMRNSLHMCTLDSGFFSTPSVQCLSPVVPNLCYTLQGKDVRIEKTARNVNNYLCSSREIHLSHAQRGVQIDIKKVSQHPKTKKESISVIKTVGYQLFLVDHKGVEHPNIHNNKGSPSSYSNETAYTFYYQLTELFNQQINDLNLIIPVFDFNFNKFTFRAKSIQLA